MASLTRWFGLPSDKLPRAGPSQLRPWPHASCVPHAQKGRGGEAGRLIVTPAAVVPPTVMPVVVMPVILGLHHVLLRGSVLAHRAHDGSSGGAERA